VRVETGRYREMVSTSIKCSVTVSPSLSIGLLVRLRFLVVALACGASLGTLATTAHAQTGFEGVMRFEFHGMMPGPDTVLVLTTKGDNLRQDIGDPPLMSMLRHADAHSVAVVMHPMKMYMRMTADDAKQMAASDQLKQFAASMQAWTQSAGGASPAPDSSILHYTVAPLARVDTVAGVACDEYKTVVVWRDTVREGDVCAAIGTGLPVSMLRTMGRGNALWIPGTDVVFGPRTDALDRLDVVLGPRRGILRVRRLEGDSEVVRMVATKIV
jgi:hypothetical protein